LHKDDFSPETSFPLGDLDFECNGLILTPQNDICYPVHTIKNPVVKFRMLQDVIEDIKKMIAKPVKPMEYRMIKMIDRGFSVVDRYITVFPTHISTVTEGHCIICFTELGSDPHIKNKCCDARYHQACYAQAVKNATNLYNNIHACMMCRREMPFRLTRRTHTENFCEII
jgi:hypothetical protein